MCNPYAICPLLEPEFDWVDQPHGWPIPIMRLNDPVRVETTQDWSTDGYAEPLERWHDRAYEPQRKAVRLDGHWR